MTKEKPTHNQRLSEHANVIAVCIFVLTAVLVFITGWYAWSTHKMVQIMAKDFEVSNRPYLAVRTMDKTVNVDHYLFWYSLSNNGKIPAVIRKILVTGSTPASGETKVLERTERSFVLQPGASIRNDLVKIDSDSIASSYGIKLEIKYGSPGNMQAPYETVYTYVYRGNGKLSLKDSEAK